MKINKYDRQIRLWGVNGQKKLGEAKVALLSCSGAGVEALKNVVLPGVGHIEIWDDRKVQIADLSTCFFYTPNDVGRFRCQAALENLLEMNPDVKGQPHKASPLSLFEPQNRELLSSYSLLLIGGELPLSQLNTISKQCWQNSIPVIFINVLGFFIYIRNQKKLHTVEFERTAAKKYYLRLDDPFEQLLEYSKQWKIEEMMEKVKKLKEQDEDNWAKMAAQASQGKKDNQKQFEPSKERSALLKTLSAIPYPIILIQLYHSAPQNARSKQLILQKLKTYAMILGEGYRDNFVQASSRYFDLLQNPDNFLRGLDRFDFALPQQPEKRGIEDALVFLRAVRIFLEKEGHLPQLTDLPDMQTETSLYIALKEVYKRQHQKDLDKLQNILAAMPEQQKGGCQLSTKELSTFVNNLQAIYSFTYSPYYEELEKEENRDQLKWIDMQGTWRNQLLALRTWLELQQRTGKVPTLQDEAQATSIVDKMKGRYGFDSMEKVEDPMQSVVDLRYLREMLRVEGQTTMSVVSIAGAIAGQEAVKLLTHCFTPVKNGFVFSGVDGKGSAVQLI